MVMESSPRNSRIISKQFHIDNEVPMYFMLLPYDMFYKKYDLDENTKFVITTRDEQAWLKSLAKFGYKPNGQIPNIVEYENKVRDSIDPKNILWIDWNICSRTGEHLDSSDCWKKLCAFLDEPYNKDDLPDFPCENC